MGNFAILIWVALWAAIKTIFQLTGILIVGILVILILLTQYEGLVEERRDNGEDRKVEEYSDKDGYSDTDEYNDKDE